MGVHVGKDQFGPENQAAGASTLLMFGPTTTAAAEDRKFLSLHLLRLDITSFKCSSENLVRLRLGPSCCWLALQRTAAHAWPPAITGPVLGSAPGVFS